MITTAESQSIPWAQCAHIDAYGRLGEGMAIPWSSCIKLLFYSVSVKKVLIMFGCVRE